MKAILLVEDSPHDIFLTKKACERSGLPHRFTAVSDGETAMNYLVGKNSYADRVAHPVPDLVLLDLKLPNTDPHELLQWIRKQPRMAHLPVVVLTDSRKTADISRAYRSGATSYLQKHGTEAEFGEGMRILLKFWLELNIPLPDSAAGIALKSAVITSVSLNSKASIRVAATVICRLASWHT